MHGSLDLDSDESEDDLGASSSAFRPRSCSLTATSHFGLYKCDPQSYQQHLHLNQVNDGEDYEDYDDDEESENVDLGTIIISIENQTSSSSNDESIPEEQLTITSNGSKVSHHHNHHHHHHPEETSVLLSKDESQRSGKWSQESTANNSNRSSNHHPHTISCRPLSESSSVAQLSLASSLISDPNAPMCKICHLNAKEMDPLITPCRCAGTMRYIHCGCLMRWLEISSKRTRKPLSCELCQYKYQWHKKFKVRQCQFPHCSRRDKILHTLFFFSVSIMIACAIMTIMCFKHDRGQRLDPNRTELTESEIITLICGVLFFLAFFIAMYVEVKARNTLYKLLLKFIYLNQQWYIDEYDKKDTRPVDI